MKSTIYKITNKTNGMSYIGQTSKTIVQRWRVHCAPKSNCTFLKHAIEKYGAENFRIDTLFEIESEDKEILMDLSNSAEVATMAKFNTLTPNGYNLMAAGKNAYKGKRLKPTFQPKWTDEHRAKFIKTKTGMKYGPKTPEQIQKSAEGCFKPVSCVETGETWLSVKACAEHFGVKPKQISRVLVGQRKRLKRRFTLIYANKAILMNEG